MRTTKGRILGCVLMTCFSAAAASNIPLGINYQGQLVDSTGASLANGDYALSFRIYSTDAPATNLLWGPELFDGGSGTGHKPPATLVNGQFNVILDLDTNGQSLVNALITQVSQSWYLEISISNNAPITPRQQMLSAPFALNTANSEKLAGYGWEAVFTPGNPATGVILASNKLASGSIIGSQIAAGTITGNQIAAGTITGNQIAAGTITSNQIAAATITSNQIAAATITANQIAPGTITGAQIASATITSSQMVLGTLLPAAVNVSAFSNTFWSVNGNAGTTPGILGTTDKRSLQIRVGNVAGIEYRPPDSPFGWYGGYLNLPNIIAASQAWKPTVVGTNVSGAVVAGGGAPSNPFTGGGAGDFMAVFDNDCTVSGGFGNKAGSNDNDPTDAAFATVGGGLFNAASGFCSTVPGGQGNQAGGSYSFAAGVNANAANNGSFVWSDSTGTATASAAVNDVTFRASGGFRFFTSTGVAGAQLAANATAWSVLSDRNAKKNSGPVDPALVLEKLASVPIFRWHYQWEPDDATPNIGPMAQDFKEAFYPGREDKSISTLEFDGVELAAIQGLNQKLREKEVQIHALERRLEALEKLLSAKEGPGKTR